MPDCGSARQRTRRSRTAWPRQGRAPDPGPGPPPLIRAAKTPVPQPTSRTDKGRPTDRARSRSMIARCDGPNRSRCRTLTVIALAPAAKLLYCLRLVVRNQAILSSWAAGQKLDAGKSWQSSVPTRTAGPHHSTMPWVGPASRFLFLIQCISYALFFTVTTFFVFSVAGVARKKSILSNRALWARPRDACGDT